MKIGKYNVEIIGSVARGKKHPKDIDFRTFELPPTEKEQAQKIAMELRAIASQHGFNRGDLWFAWNQMPDEQVANRGYLEFNKDGWHLQLRGHIADFPEHWNKGILKSFRGEW